MVRTKSAKQKKGGGGESEGFEPPTFSEPQKGLVPVPNTPFYATPGEPASPFDCDRYPNSIYCGGTPWSRTPVGIEPAIVIDECNIGIELTPILGFTILPPVQIVYRRNTEACRPKPPPTPIPDPLGENPIFPPPEGLDGILAGLFYVNEHSFKTTRTSWDYGYQPGYNGSCDAGSHSRVVKVKINSFIFPYKDPNKVYEKFLDENKAYVSLTETEEIVATGDIYCHDGNPPDYVPPSTPLPRTYEIVSNNIDGIQIGNYTKLVIGSYATLKRVYDAGTDYSTFNKPSNYPRTWNNLSEVFQPNIRDTLYYSAEFGIAIKSDRPTADPSPPPPPPPKRCDCTMTCCPSTTQNDQLLRSLIQKVDKLSKIVGVDDYPISLPTSLISKDEGFLGNLIPNLNRDVPSLTRFLAWYVERFDEIMGQWEIPIEIKDSDPTKPGDQPLGVKLPNMAEAIAEMFTLCFQTNLNSETLLNFAVRTAAEGVTDKQQNFITYKLMQSMAEWAGYKQKDIKLKMPTLFSLGKTRYDEILNESEIDVACVDFDEKFGLEADLMRFREAVAILQSVYKRKVDPGGDIKAQILKQLLDTFAAVNKISPEDEDKGFEQFLTDVENGFINAPGANNTTEPYGRPYTERPKIRDLTKHTPPPNP